MKLDINGLKGQRRCNSDYPTSPLTEGDMSLMPLDLYFSTFFVNACCHWTLSTFLCKSRFLDQYKSIMVVKSNLIASTVRNLRKLCFSLFMFVLQSWDKTSISLTAGCDLFMRYVTRTSALEYEDFNSAKSRLLERAEKFGEISYKVHHAHAIT